MDDRCAAEACLFRHYHSLATKYRAFGWNQLPKEIRVSPATANRRFREWTERGVWSLFWHQLNRLRAGRARPQPLQSPGSQIILELERAYSFLNARLFANALPMTVLITIEPSRRFHGMCRNGPDGRQWIAISTNFLGLGTLETLHTLLHEMVHVRNRSIGISDCHRKHHNRHFRDSAALIGLECRHGKYGYAETIPGEAALHAFANFDAKDVFAWPTGRNADFDESLTSSARRA